MYTPGVLVRLLLSSCLDVDFFFGHTVGCALIILIEMNLTRRQRLVLILLGSHKVADFSA